MKNMREDKNLKRFTSIDNIKLTQPSEEEKIARRLFSGGKEDIILTEEDLEITDEDRANTLFNGGGKL